MAVQDAVRTELAQGRLVSIRTGHIHLPSSQKTWWKNRGIISYHIVTCVDPSSTSVHRFSLIFFPFLVTIRISILFPVSLLLPSP
jgi:hypothetical protein